MGRKALRTTRDELPEIDSRERIAISNIARSLSPQDLHRLNESLGGNGNHQRLSDLTGITRRHIQRFLKGTHNASFEVATRICDAANVTLDELRYYRYIQFRDETRDLQLHGIDSNPASSNPTKAPVPGTRTTNLNGPPPAH